MEFVSGITIKKILLHNGNWWKFFAKYRTLIRISILVNVVKVLMCRTEHMGFIQYACQHCPFIKKVFFTCKSRFCSSCGKKATDQWIKKNFDVLPDTTWQHITFTLPDVLWEFFWLNRELLNTIPSLAAQTIQTLAAKKKANPGIFAAIHTFGRNLKRNVHIHLSTTCGGLSSDNKKWISLYFNAASIKSMWRYNIINLFREQYKLGNLKLPKSLRHIKNYQAFNAWLDYLYKKNWYVHLQKTSKNHKRNIEYLGRYIKRPPLGETRIKRYENGLVTFEYLDHYNNTTETITLPVLDFIARLVAHIPDKHFRMIRYYGWLSNRTRGVLLDVVYKLLTIPLKEVKPPVTWRELFFKSFGIDPLECPCCKMTLVFQFVRFGLDPPGLLELHGRIEPQAMTTC
jgi:hypothetical protein